MYVIKRPSPAEYPLCMAHDVRGNVRLGLCFERVLRETVGYSYVVLGLVAITALLLTVTIRNMKPNANLPETQSHLAHYLTLSSLGNLLGISWTRRASIVVLGLYTYYRRTAHYKQRQ